MTYWFDTLTYRKVTANTALSLHSIKSRNYRFFFMVLPPTLLAPSEYIIVLLATVTTLPSSHPSSNLKFSVGLFAYLLIFSLDLFFNCCWVFCFFGTEDQKRVFCKCLQTYRKIHSKSLFWLFKLCSKYSECFVHCKGLRPSQKTISKKYFWWPQMTLKLLEQHIATEVNTLWNSTNVVNHILRKEDTRK